MGRGIPSRLKPPPWAPMHPNKIKSLAHWIRVVRWLVRQDYDQVIVITGEERLGKSTLAFRLAHALEDSFSMQRCVFRARDMVEMANDAPRHSVIWLDEAIEGGNSREAMSKPNRELMNYFTVAGERNLIYLILWPRLGWLDKHLKNHRSHWLIKVRKRGRASIHWPSDGEWTTGRFWAPIGGGSSPFLFNFDDAKTSPNPRVRERWQLYLDRKTRFVDDTGRAIGDTTDRDRQDNMDHKRELVRETIRERGPWIEHLREQVPEKAKP